MGGLIIIVSLKITSKRKRKGVLHGAMLGRLDFASAEMLDLVGESDGREKAMPSCLLMQRQS